MLYAAVADDDTGASDLAGMFADQGVRVVLVLNLPERDDLARWTAGADGVVFAMATRALPPAKARERTAHAVHLARQLAPRTLQIKYCSTFDSTETGNIGPSIDAAMDATGERFTIALPALPINGRTTYCGYHFVQGRLLSDSPMRHHPLTPMTNSDLVDHLSRQTATQIELTPYSIVEQGPDAIARHWASLRSQGTGISIVDCLSERHAADICDAACELPLITGGSAFGMHLPSAWRRRGWISGTDPSLLSDTGVAEGVGALVVAGSCSVATAGQNAWLSAQDGTETFEVDVLEFLNGRSPAYAKQCVLALREGRPVLLKTMSTPEAIEAVRVWAIKQALDSSAAGLRIAEALGDLTRQIVEEQPPRILVSAGGETSSALCRALGIRCLAVGRNIQPGVPLCLPVEGAGIPLVLKSGNFGTEDFYGVAISAAELARKGVRAQ